MSETKTEAEIEAKAEKSPEKKTEKKPEAKAAAANPEQISFLKKLRGADLTASRVPACIAYLYLAIPMYIFMFGWMRSYIAVTLAIITTVGLFLACKSAPKLDVSIICGANTPKLFGIILFAMVWVYMSGIGGYAFQNYDHMWRNAILEKLVSQDWPVIIEDSQPYFQKPVALIYYFALWLPAACFGKVFGLSAAHTFLYWWCVAGVTIVFSLISCLNKKASSWIMLAFVFFSGLDAVGDFIMHNSTNYLWFGTNHLENWGYGFQMSSFTTQLFWVFNQAIPAWIITLLLLCQKDNRSVIFIYSFSFMSCTLPSIGMLPILACIGISRIIKSYDKKKPFADNVKAICAEAFTFQNLISGVMIALVSYLFLKSNASSENGFRKTDMDKLMMSYLIFSLLEFLVYFFVIYRTQKRNPLYWVSLITLIIVPMISFGPHIDFVMRASIPALMVLFLLVVDSIRKNFAAKDVKSIISGVATLAIFAAGGLTVYHELARSVCTTVEHSYNPDVSLIATEIDLFEDGFRGNFFGEYEDSIFFKYIAK